MVDYLPYTNTTMSHDFPLYSTEEQQLDFLPTSQPFLPSTSYPMDPTFSAPFEPLPNMSEAPRPQDFQFHYDGIAQGVKSSFQHYTSPMASPHSASLSFQEQPPVLSASSESGASVSSSAMGSPSQFNEPWNPLTSGLGLTSGFEYPGMVDAVKVPGCVGESISVPFKSSFSSSPSPASPQSHLPHTNVFRTPNTPASASWPASRSSAIAGRRNSLLSNEVRLSDLADAGLESPFTPTSASSQSSQSQTNLFTPSESSCWFSLSPPILKRVLYLETCTDRPADPTLTSFGNPLAYMPPSPLPYPEIRTTQSPYFGVMEHPPSPALSNISSHSKRPGSKNLNRGSTSPYLTDRFQPYPSFNGQRRQSNASLHSQHSGTSRKSASSYELDDETREKGMCPLPECGRVFKDLKAHMLTHQNERPEKCPITTCEYNTKGFARKYDKNRHTLTHYKGTMVCGFCPGSGSAAEKSFNRADVFKRHLTSVHGVEQNPPNSRKKSPTGRKSFTNSQQNLTGTCSTCSVTFANAQEFYEHLDDCVLRVVQQADPSEAINQRLLTSVAEDKEVSETLDRNGLSNSIEYTVPSYDDDEEEDEEEEYDADDAADDTYGTRRSRSGKGSIKNKSH